MAISPPKDVTHTDIESFVAAGPLDMWPTYVGGGDACLLVTIDGVDVSAMPHPECRGLMITVEADLAEYYRLTLERPGAIRNAIYAIVNAMGEPLRLACVGGCGKDHDRTVPPWFLFEVEQQEDENED